MLGRWLATALVLVQVGCGGDGGGGGGGSGGGGGEAGSTSTGAACTELERPSKTWSGLINPEQEKFTLAIHDNGSVVAWWCHCSFEESCPDGGSFQESDNRFGTVGTTTMAEGEVSAELFVPWSEDFSEPRWTVSGTYDCEGFVGELAHDGESQPLEMVWDDSGQYCPLH